MHVFKPTTLCRNCTVADEPMDFLSIECPAGYICDMARRRQANCSIIRQNYMNLGFGDVLAGSYCPRGIHSLQLCPIGQYCPDPNTSILCPERFFCPHKSLHYRIPCQECKTGSVIFKRNMLGYITCILVVCCIGIIVLYRIFIIRRRHRTAVQEEDVGSDRKPARPNVALCALLEDISKRIGVSALHSGSWDDFDAEVLFDCCDITQEQVVSYDSINQMMHLNPKQLDRFRWKMNECACLNLNSLTVPRNVFIPFFFEAMTFAINFSPSSDQVLALFHEIGEQQSSNQDAETIDMSGMYESSIASFLSEEQISSVVRYMKCSTKESTINQSDESVPSSVTIHESSHLDISSSSDDTASSSLEVKVKGPTFWRILKPLTSKQMNSIKSSGDTIRKIDFMKSYPEALARILDGRPFGMRIEGIDVSFETLSLEVLAGDIPTVVVDRVTGRIRRGEMTALMGCSGAGKTSLLNALCGRAYYGKISGSIKINGHETCIEQHRDAIAFVPQDDILYSELTVRENLVFAGKFRLPRGTTSEEIEYIAEKTMSSLGLGRVAHSIVGDVTIRGISGGEKKRLNIGIEMMAQPSILFCDEPTSGLDATSALHVMKALKALVDHEGVTICSAIHQPRKFIFELFDTLILLGLGGKILYHGPTMGSKPYFTKLHYVLPPSESVADWLLDISSGHLKRVHHVNTLNYGEWAMHDSEVIISLHDEWERHLQSLDSNEFKSYSVPDTYSLPANRLKIPFIEQLICHVKRNFLVTRRNTKTKLIDTALIVGGICLVSFFVGEFKPTQDIPPDIRNEYDVLTSTDKTISSQAMPDIFKVSIFSDCKTFALSASAITSTLLALTASKAITEKREEFFREAGAGYNINPFFLAINISTTIEQGLQALLASAVAFWLRKSLCHWMMYALNFLLLGWISVSWGLLFAITIPPKNVVLVIGFFMLFGSLLISGVSSPVQYHDIYSNKAIAIFSGLFSPTRYFIEAIIVSEYRVLPPQYGFSMETSPATFPMEKNMFSVTSLAQNDFPRVVYWFPINAYGWFWGLLPSFLVGLTVRIVANLAIITCNRSKQVKESLWKELKTSRSCRICMLSLFSAFSLSFGLTVFAILHGRK